MRAVVTGLAVTVPYAGAGVRRRGHHGTCSVVEMRGGVPLARSFDAPGSDEGTAATPPYPDLHPGPRSPFLLHVYLRLQLALGVLLLALEAVPAPWSERTVTGGLALACFASAVLCWQRDALPSPPLVWATLAVVVMASLVAAALPHQTDIPWLALVSTGLLAVAVAAGRFTATKATAATGAIVGGWAAQLVPDHGVTALRVLLSAVLAVAVAYGVTSIRRHMVARETTAARAQSDAAAHARRDELRRQQLLLHDHAALLAVLATPGLTPQLEDAARRQAADAARAVRAFLAAESSEPVGNAPRTLDQIVRSVAAEFRDLPLEVVSGLATEHTIPAEQARAVDAALTTVLHNVRQHAHADHVVVHADHMADSQNWELYVRDDGVGFDVTTTRWGFGLREQAAAELERVGINLTVWSEPTEGTRVVIAAPARLAP